MGYQIFKPNGVCTKCGFPIMQMFRQFFDSPHELLIDKSVITCKIKGEHVHLECCCGYEFVCRPLDWELKNKKGIKK